MEKKSQIDTLAFVFTVVFLKKTKTNLVVIFLETVFLKNKKE
jgi:hypothetical protein